MSWTFCLSGAAIVKAGEGANTDIVMSGAVMDVWSDQAEALINTITRKDWITNPPTTNFLNILGDVESDLVAMKIINYDVDGYLDPSLMLNVLSDNISRNLSELKKSEVQEVMD